MTKQHYQDAGLDVQSNIDTVIPPHHSAVISTNLFLAIPENHVGLIWARSGLSVKHQIEVGAGCIDSGYRGEVMVHLYNHSDTDFYIRKGDRIAQLLTVPVNLTPYEEVEELDDTERSSNGLGSTGVSS